ncbi:class I adenylate-forming enzyme family protein [Mycolicibacterium mucogenicum]|uniref:Acyl--CoA ligase n=1 Tax=Mycolicibacterium mucogenicum DSM 44124 TaxID=1226753 RepID=A0A8H2J982_MYCMU|nr:class I adenylate-forming enzyme family protein [Mycolicibacterium mucogenicum]KAB7761357.1 long-chain fatty acid--CoA ligase [Mycolicibacterium mucogenicum DSM 44124]QPG70182.1 acyl--CoA ligase [Mycolicibacterium mucogenicum DSM 44124]
MGASVEGVTLTESYWPADRSVPLVDFTVGALLADRAAAFPDREALVAVRHGTGETARLTYRELFDEACRVATGLRRIAQPGDYVALWAPNVVEWTTIQYGAALAGVVLVALNPVLPAADLDYALRHCGAVVLLHAEESRGYAMADVARDVCAAISGLRRISLSDSGAWRADHIDHDVVARAPVDHDRPVMLQYTSGTTGRPKGVVLTHRALVNVAKLTMEAAEIESAAVCLNPLPLFHTAGCVIATLGPLWVAGTAVVCERFVAHEVLDALRFEEASVLFFVPTVLTALLAAQEVSRQRPPPLRVIMGGAATVSPQLIDSAAEVFGAGVFNLYGQTELAPVLTLTRPTDTRDERLSTVGRPLPQVDCRIVDPATGDIAPIGQVGEICARGYQQFVEYLHDPEATARALDPDHFVRTGDLGRMDSRGFVSVTGRLKELIIRGGENIAPAEVERVVVAHDEVSDAVAVGLPDERLGEIVAVVCRVADRAELKADLVDHARRHLPAYKVPARWFVIDAYPSTATGKVQRHALAAAIERGELHEL